MELRPPRGRGRRCGPGAPVTRTGPEGRRVPREERRRLQKRDHRLPRPVRLPHGGRGAGAGGAGGFRAGETGDRTQAGWATGTRGQVSDALRAGRLNPTFFLVIKVIKAHYRKRRELGGRGALPSPSPELTPLTNGRAFSAGFCACIYNWNPSVRSLKLLFFHLAVCYF